MHPCQPPLYRTADRDASRWWQWKYLTNKRIEFLKKDLRRKILLDKFPDPKTPQDWKNRTAAGFQNRSYLREADHFVDRPHPD